MDQPAIFTGIDDAHRRADQLHEVAGAAHLLQHAGMFELTLEGDHIGQGVVLHPAADRREDAGMDGVGEMFGGEEFRDAFKSLVVGQQRAEKRLFCLQILGW